MKKLLIATAALAVVSGIAHAQSSVTIYGILDASYSSKESTTLKYSATGNSNSQTKTNTNGIAGNGAESTSRLGFRGTEDLGGGLKANFVFETALNPAEATMSTWSNRQAFVGLEGGFGTLNMGTVYSQAHIISAGFSASTLPNVVGDVMYVQSGGSLNQTFDKFGITTTGLTSGKTAATQYNAAFATIALTTVLADRTALVNAELSKAGLAPIAAGTTVAVDAVTSTPNTGTSVVFTAGTSDGTTSNTTAQMAGAQNLLNQAKALVDAASTTALNKRLAIASNISYNVRSNNTVTYMSPDMSGFKIGAQYSLPTQTKIEGGDETTSSASQLSVGYAAGNFAAAAVHTTGDTKSLTNTSAITADTSPVSANVLAVLTSAGTDAASVRTTVQAPGIQSTAAKAASVATVEVKTKEQLAALSYDLGVAKVSYIYAKRNAKDTVSDLSEKTTHSFGVKAPFGKTTAFAIYSMGDTKVLDGTASAAKFDLDGIQVGASYAMSKRTDVYAIYGTNKMDNKANANDIKDKQYAVGIRHSF